MGVAKWDSERERDMTEGCHPSCAEAGGSRNALNDKLPSPWKPLFLFPNGSHKPCLLLAVLVDTLTKAREAHHCRLLGEAVALFTKGIYFHMPP